MINEESFTEFHRRTSEAFWSYLFRLTADRSLADDMLQDSYVRLINKAPDGLDGRQLKSYLYQIGTRIFYDHLRTLKRKRRWFAESANGAGPSGDEIEQSEAADQTSSITGDQRRTVARALNDLTPQERSLLWLAHVEGYTHEEIAQIHGLSPASIKVLLFRARKRLKEVLGAMGIQSIGDV